MRRQVRLNSNEIFYHLPEIFAILFYKPLLSGIFSVFPAKLFSSLFAGADRAKSPAFPPAPEIRKEGTIHMMYTPNWKNSLKTWARRFLALCLCLPVLAALTGCGDGKVQSTVSEVVSRLGDDVSETVSRVEDALDGDNTSSWLDDEASRMHGDGNLDSDLADDGVIDDEGADTASRAGDTVSAGENSKLTKDR